ncbi:MAG TPA: zinc metallopeptidase [Herpetosiphonaceae bacterium]|jgi:Zn-dependent membrane protease YugP|nr:zinc metallopeptidase [Herpetosiphonaceae bacterium]
MFFLDPMYFVFALPAMLFALWAQHKVKSTFARYSKVRNMHNVSGLEVAQVLMRNEGLEYLQVNQIPGDLTDFYNPADRSINLSQGSTSVPSVAAMAVVAHELGHAVQDKQGYFWMQARAGIVGIANIGSNLGPMMFFIGLLLGGFSGSTLGWNIALLGFLLFAGAVVFTLLTLPVELNASKRARVMLMNNGLVSATEMEGVSAMLNAAALTYVAAAAQAVSVLLYYAFILFGGRRR